MVVRWKTCALVRDGFESFLTGDLEECAETIEALCNGLIPLSISS